MSKSLGSQGQETFRRMRQEVREDERRERQVFVQRRNKDGRWSKPYGVDRLRGTETPVEVVERMTRNNPGVDYRLDPTR